MVKSCKMEAEDLASSPSHLTLCFYEEPLSHLDSSALIHLICYYDLLTYFQEYISSAYPLRRHYLGASMRSCGLFTAQSCGHFQRCSLDSIFPLIIVVVHLCIPQCFLPPFTLAFLLLTVLPSTVSLCRLFLDPKNCLRRSSPETVHFLQWTKNSPLSYELFFRWLQRVSVHKL